MGADLYIRSITEPAHKKYEPLFSRAVERRNKFNAEHPRPQSPEDAAKSDKLQKTVSRYYEAMYPTTGYFRDSYNSSSLLALLGLSWWVDVGSMLTKNGLLMPHKAKLLLAKIEAAQIPVPDAEMKKQIVKNGDTVEDWIKYFTAKRKRFIAYLKRAIKLKESIYCSI